MRSFGAVSDDPTPDWRVYSAGFQADEFINTPSISGIDESNASVTLGDQATLTAGDGSEYVPTSEASLTTVKFVEDLVGSGGNVNPDTVPGTGATAQWVEQRIAVADVPQWQQYGTLYAYDGIFTDGLHWTSDGYQWYTSDPSSRVGNIGSYAQYDNGKTVKGSGNEYMTSRYISSDMKAWRNISGIGLFPFYLDGDFYSSEGSKKYDRANSSWQDSTPFGGSLSDVADVASQESGLYVLAVDESGTVHWSVGLDGGSAWQQVPSFSDAKCCTFLERMDKWLVISESTFSISDGENLSVANWTTAALPTSAAWDRITDDGGTISITSTADNFNLVVYCTEADGPSVESDWQSTVSYNNRGYNGFAGTNGRTIGSMDQVLEGDERVAYYAISGDIRINGATDTSQIKLTNPEDPNFFAAAPTALLTTQEDANKYFAEEIAKKATVVTLTQDAYDAIPADEIDANTLYLIT